jgi:uncharacterized membrane protein YtjA (UPF0391 family)
MTMLKWTVLCLVISVVTGFAGFSRNGTTLAGPARALFFIAAAMLLVISALSLFEIQ